MHHGHRAPDRDGVTGTAAGPDQVRGHQRLAVAGPERVERAEPERKEQGHQHERPGPSDETREGTTGDVGSRPGRFGAFGTSGHRSSDAGVEGDGRPVDVQRARQEVLWVRQECVRHAALGDRRVDDRRAVGTGRGHLAPADPVAEVGIGEHELTFRRERSGERRLQPEDVEPSLPGAHTQRRRDDVERHLRSVHRERQTHREIGRGASGPPRAFGFGEGPVGVGVDLRAELDRGDLGQVDHVVDPHLARRELDARVPVDREVAERMGRGGARSPEHDRDHADQQDRSADGSSHRPASSLASVLAAASACWIEKFGFVASAAER